MPVADVSVSCYGLRAEPLPNKNSNFVSELLCSSFEVKSKNRKIPKRKKKYFVEKNAS